jgi:outer membrane lipoprotein-sorting protein
MERMKNLLLAALLCLSSAALPSLAQAQPHAAVLSDADNAVLRQVEAYLNGLTSLKGHFLQIAPDGGTSTGTMWLVRPGRLRFQYDPPSPLLLLASHGLVVFRDTKLDQTSNIPEGETPLGLLLRDTITLTGDVTVTDLQRPPGLIEITLTKTRAPGDGTLTLVLEADKLALTGWSVVDAQGRETRIRLTDMSFGGHYDNSLFTYVDLNALSPNSNTP